MTRPTSVASFLRASKGKDFCDDCLEQKVGVNRHEAQTITDSLHQTSEFKRTEGACSLCRKTKKVTQAL